MAKAIDWDKHIGRRLRLRDLHLFFTIVQHRSMAKAAAELRISQPSVSAQIGQLERVLGVRLFDRSPQGVELTAYGQALLVRGRAAFDELRQGLRDIAFLADPGAGEVRVGCSENALAGLLPPIVERLSRSHSRVSVKAAAIVTNPPDLRELDERKLDVVLGPVWKGLPPSYGVEFLLMDSICIAVGAKSRWAGRRKIKITELADEPWIMAPAGTPSRECIINAFMEGGRPAPVPAVETYSIHLRNQLAATGRFVAVMPTSVMRLHAGPFELVALPIELPNPQRGVAAITVKGRTLTPLVEIFLECARVVGKSMSIR